MKLYPSCNFVEISDAINRSVYEMLQANELVIISKNKFVQNSNKPKAAFKVIKLYNLPCTLRHLLLQLPLHIMNLKQNNLY